MVSTLYYVHDPMCSWCWAFQGVWQKVLTKLPTDLNLQYVVGGLAPDSELPMPQAMRDMLQSTWQRIQQQVPGTEFNFDFWAKNTPRRSTYPACRAVLIASRQSFVDGEKMITAIQNAYYLNAKNPSDDKVLIDLAESLGMDKLTFSEQLNSEATNQLLNNNLRFAHQIGAAGFPSLILQQGNETIRLAASYTDWEYTLQSILQARSGEIGLS